MLSYKFDFFFLFYIYVINYHMLNAVNNKICTPSQIGSDCLHNNVIVIQFFYGNLCNYFLFDGFLCKETYNGCTKTYQISQKMLISCFVVHLCKSEYRFYYKYFLWCLNSNMKLQSIFFSVKSLNAGLIHYLKSYVITSRNKTKLNNKIEKYNRKKFNIFSIEI